jgi:catechol 2,3-dioxygenase-like lactoylglutathione lyase family enzyme
VNNEVDGGRVGRQDVPMAEPRRLVTVVLEVADLDRSVSLYRDGFGLDLLVSDHEGGEHGRDDRWISGRHAATTWTDGAFLHFALYEAKGASTSGVQLSIEVPDVIEAHRAAVAAGATVIHEPRPEPWGASARYRDLDDNVVELTQRG